MIITDIGEIGVHHGSQTYVLRPSLYAMSKLGSPEDILQVYANVMSDAPSKYQDEVVLSVLYECYGGEEDISDIFGYIEDGELHEGLCSKKHRLIYARSLMRHGITGALPPLPKKGHEPEEYMTEFQAREMVALGMAHLGLSEREAWNMTMTGLVSALRAKFPPIEDPNASKAPSVEKTKETLAWFDKLKAKKNKGMH